MDNLLLSVVMITYNHENYIKEAIDGVLMQKCDFDFEFIIVNDFSSDNTNSIIISSIKNFKSNIRIKYVSHPSNMGMIPNFIYGLNQAKSKYVAYCEGDDYWTDPYKLQKQVDFVEKNTDYVMCFTRYKIFYEEDKMFKLGGLNYNKKYLLKDFMHANHAATATVVFRNMNIDFNLLKSGPLGDWLLYNLLLKHGDAYYLNEVTSVYRRHYYNSEFYNPLPYKKKLYKMNLILLKIHRLDYSIVFFKNILKLFFFNKLY